MKEIIDIEVNLKIHNVFLDSLKSEHMLTAQNLLWAIYTYEDEMTPENEKDIIEFATQLTDLREKLMSAIEEHIRLVEETSRTVEYHLMEEK